MEPETPPKKLQLYFDDSGSRDPDKAHAERDDGGDWFGLGGILVGEEAIDAVWDAHSEFCASWEITYPLHSTRIRGRRNNFRWLRQPGKLESFLTALQEYILSQPIVCLACVIDRPGYVARYKETHKGGMWLLCKTAFTILAERAAKYADSRGRKLEIYFEQAGEKEDGYIKSYLRELKKTGNPFSAGTSDGYAPLAVDDYRRIIVGEPKERTKKSPMIQLADLVLYPMAKSGYDSNYAPYAKLKEAGRLIDCHLKPDEIASCGIKYSCFDWRKI